MLRIVVPLLAAALVTSCVSSGGVAPEVRAQLAPTGELRAGMNTGNTLFTTKQASGELQGVSVDIMTELARRGGRHIRQHAGPERSGGREAIDEAAALDER